MELRVAKLNKADGTTVKEIIETKWTNGYSAIAAIGTYFDTISPSRLYVTASITASGDYGAVGQVGQILVFDPIALTLLSALHYTSPTADQLCWILDISFSSSHFFPLFLKDSQLAYHLPKILKGQTQLQNYVKFALASVPSVKRGRVAVSNDYTIVWVLGSRNTANS